MNEAKERDGLPDLLSITKQSIEQWRAKRRPRSRLPEDLWREAIELARVHGVNKVARTLKLDYYSLKKRVSVAEIEPKAPEFIQILDGAAAIGKPECVIELEDGSGAKLRISLRGAGVPDIPALARAFREPWQ